MSIAILAAATTADAQLRATGTYRLKDIREQCIILSQVRIGPQENVHDAARCRVSSFVAFGTVGDTVYYRGLYCLTPHRYAREEHGARALAIFVAKKESETARLLLERATPETGVLLYGEPAIVTNSDGTILDVSVALDGTSVGNQSEYYLLRDGAWHPIDARSWLTNLKTRIPSGLEVWKGVWPDLKTMTAEIDLYRSGDANCCPTGGTLHATLRVQVYAFVLTSVRYAP